MKKLMVILSLILLVVVMSCEKNPNEPDVNRVVIFNPESTFESIPFHLHGAPPFEYSLVETPLIDKSSYKSFKISFTVSVEDSADTASVFLAYRDENGIEFDLLYENSRISFHKNFKMILNVEDIIYDTIYFKVSASFYEGRGEISNIKIFGYK